jgi:hypothetical protein
VLKTTRSFFLNSPTPPKKSQVPELVSVEVVVDVKPVSELSSTVVLSELQEPSLLIVYVFVVIVPSEVPETVVPPEV